MVAEKNTISRPGKGRYLGENRGANLLADGQSTAGFFKCGFFCFRWITKFPGILGERDSLVNKVFEGRVQINTLLSDLFQTMGFTKGDIMPG